MKSYNELTESYLRSNGLSKQHYLDQTGQKVTVLLTAKEKEKREERGMTFLPKGQD